MSPTSHVFVDESKRLGYVIAAVTVTNPVAARKVVRSLILPGQRRVHMVRERPARKKQIVDALCAMTLTVNIYDAGHHHPNELAARAACLQALLADLKGNDTHLTIEQDDGLLRYDNQWLIEATRATGQRETLRYEHRQAYWRRSVIRCVHYSSGGWALWAV
jgi:hypothetical protein